MRVEFWKDCRQFLNEFVSTILSTVAARFLVGQGQSCFSLEITVAGDDYSAFYFFGRLIDGLLNPGLVKGCKVEATEGKFHSFMSERRQVDQSGGLLIVITDVFSICCGQPGFRFRRRLCRGSFWPKKSHFSFRNLRCNTFHI